MRELLSEVQLVLYDMADTAGDVPEWNEGGSLYDLSKRIKEALIEHSPATATAAEIDKARASVDIFENIMVDDEAKAAHYPGGVWVQAWLQVEDDQ